ncbi:hypothetical protein [Halorussus ruber]|uniref:hypothetical protein n=1 Tax=Halorussus ruber TaxID=1126238 RepID=UPI001092FEC6|nr:hypothetical protein [Halorussus ruber]
MSDFVRRTSRYLDDHWVLKRFVVPVLFMASMLFVVGLLTTATAGETGQLVGLFAGFSLAVVALGLTLGWGVRRAVGWNLFASNRERDRGE